MFDIEIAVIIVTFKSAQLTINSLSSLAKERDTPGVRIRVYVIDNASGDLASVIRASVSNNWTAWVTPIQSPINGGFAYGNNLGIVRAYQDGPPSYFYFLNPDTEVRAGAVGSLVRFLENHPSVGIAGSGIDNPDGSEWPIAFRFPSLLSEFIGGLGLGMVSRFLRRWEIAQQMSRESQPVDWVCGASMMIRPALFDAIGTFDENYFLYFEETDLCYRARKAGFSTWYVPEGRVMHIVGQSTKVTERVARPRRLPTYWFESRRRYFAVHLGIANAIAVDLVALIAFSLGLIKRIALRRKNSHVPSFIRDLIRNSVIWRRNRTFPPARSFHPSRMINNPNLHNASS